MTDNKKWELNEIMLILTPSLYINKIYSETTVLMLYKKSDLYKNFLISEFWLNQNWICSMC